MDATDYRRVRESEAGRPVMSGQVPPLVKRADHVVCLLRGASAALDRLELLLEGPGPTADVGQEKHIERPPGLANMVSELEGGAGLLKERLERLAARMGGEVNEVRPVPQFGPPQGW